jgi:hypothetical protein
LDAASAGLIGCFLAFVDNKISPLTPTLPYKPLLLGNLYSPYIQQVTFWLGLFNGLAVFLHDFLMVLTYARELCLFSCWQIF